MTQIKLLHGDCLDKLKELEDNSVDSVVTDPPYGIAFMNKEWDNPKKLQEQQKKDKELAIKRGKIPASFSPFPGQGWKGKKEAVWFQEWTEDWARECMRVLKPGGHLISFCAPRMYHRMTVGIEDAGFEIRDQLMWVFGSGFPKSHNIGKAVDKLQGNEREVIEPTGRYKSDFKNNKGKVVNTRDVSNEDRINIQITKGNSEWEGWGTALKPAHEPIVMARKPFKGSVAQNVLEWGTGGINIDECRIGSEERTVPVHSDDVKDDTTLFGLHPTIQHERVATTEGRFPANIIFDEEAGKILDEQSGITKSVSGGKSTGRNFGQGEKEGSKSLPRTGHNDTGGASRFFYCPKASKKDRNEGCDELEEKQSQLNSGGIGRKTSVEKRLKTNGENAPKSKNIHPTVKPTDLMAYLVRLVTPKGGTVLDPFMGSGSTGKAAVREGMDFIGIEREDEYMEIAKTRIEHEQSKHNYRNFWE